MSLSKTLYPLLRSNKKYVFRVTRPYLNLLLKPRIFSGFLEKKFFLIFCILKGILPFKMHKIIFLFPKKKEFKNICVPTQTSYPNTYFFIWPKYCMVKPRKTRLDMTKKLHSMQKVKKTKVFCFGLWPS